MVTKDDRKLLNESIDKADAVILRQVLKQMCESSEECHNQAAKHLIVPAVAGAKRKSGQDAQADASKKSKTAPTSKFEKCVTCEKTFDVTNNRNDACQTHDGQWASGCFRRRKGQIPRSLLTQIFRHPRRRSGLLPGRRRGPGRRH